MCKGDRVNKQGGAAFDPALYMAKWRSWLVDGDAGAVAVAIRIPVTVRIVDVGGMPHVCDREGHAGVVALDIALGNAALAVAVGLVQGGIQALSRAFFAKLIPVGKAAEFFGFYNMLGKFAAIIGPAMMGWVGVLADSSRVGILSLLILFLTGSALLIFVRVR